MLSNGRSWPVFLLHLNYLNAIESMKRMTPPTSPPIRVQKLSFCRRGHPTSMVENESTRDDHDRFVRSSSMPFTQTVLQAQETSLDHLIRERAVNGGWEGGIQGRVST